MANDVEQAALEIARRLCGSDAKLIASARCEKQLVSVYASDSGLRCFHKVGDKSFYVTNSQNSEVYVKGQVIFFTNLVQRLLCGKSVKSKGTIELVAVPLATNVAALSFFRKIKGFIGHRTSDNCFQLIGEELIVRRLHAIECKITTPKFRFDRQSWQQVQVPQKPSSISEEISRLEEIDTKAMSEFVDNYLKSEELICRHFLTDKRHDNQNAVFVYSTLNDNEILRAINEKRLAVEQVAPLFERPFNEPHPWRRGSSLIGRDFNVLTSTGQPFPLDKPRTLRRNLHINRYLAKDEEIEWNRGEVEPTWCYVISDGNLTVYPAVALLPKDAFDNGGKVSVFLNQITAMERAWDYDPKFAKQHEGARTVPIIAAFTESPIIEIGEFAFRWMRIVYLEKMSQDLRSYTANAPENSYVHWAMAIKS